MPAVVILAAMMSVRIDRWVAVSSSAVSTTSTTTALMNAVPAANLGRNGISQLKVSVSTPTRHLRNGSTQFAILKHGISPGQFYHCKPSPSNHCQRIIRVNKFFMFTSIYRYASYRYPTPNCIIRRPLSECRC